MWLVTCQKGPQVTPMSPLPDSNLCFGAILTRCLLPLSFSPPRYKTAVLIHLDPLPVVPLVCSFQAQDYCSSSS